MTCKACVHYDVCGGYTPTDLDQDVFDYCREGKADEIPDIEKRCKDFKNKADFVEVVRCKDCNGSYIARDGKMRCALQDDIPLVEPSHFCSYGERK